MAYKTVLVHCNDKRRIARVGELLERGGADVDPAALAQRVQRAEQAGVLVRRGEDLVARPEGEPGEDAHDALARARGERDVGRVGAEALRVGRALTVAQREHPLHVRARPALDRRAGEHVGHGVQGAARQRAARAGVEIGVLVEHGELGSESGGIHGPGP